MLGPEEGDDRIAVSASALCTSEEQVIRVGEALARVVTGLALEGINLNINYTLLKPDQFGPFGQTGG